MRVRTAVTLHKHLASAESYGQPKTRWLDRAGLADVLHDWIRPDYKGGVLWHDALVHSPQRLLMELLRWARHCGARCLNYTQVEALIQHRGRVVGVRACDRRTGFVRELRSDVVIRCAGASHREMRLESNLLPQRRVGTVVEFGLWLNVKAPCPGMALVLPSRGRRRPPMMLVPHARGMLAGTRRLESGREAACPEPNEEHVYDFIRDLNSAWPALRLRLEHVLQVKASLVPARPAALGDHLRSGKPAGLHSVRGVDYAMARRIACRVLRRIFRERLPEIAPDALRPQPIAVPTVDQVSHMVRPGNSGAAQLLQFMHDEQVVHLDDLVLRRTDWFNHPETFDRVAEVVCAVCGWDESRRILERARLGLAWRRAGGRLLTSGRRRTLSAALTNVGWIRAGNLETPSWGTHGSGNT